MPLALLLVLVACAGKEPATATDTSSTAGSTTTEQSTTTVDTSTTADGEVQFDRYNHYKLWAVKAAPVHFPVTLDGAGLAAWPTEVRMAKYLANPAAKTHDRKPYGIIDKDLHYIAYELRDKTKPPRNSASVTDQFSDHMNWELKQSTFLLVPASKAEKGDPAEPKDGEQHYLCFEANGTPPQFATLTIADQFDRDAAETIKALKPAQLCFPVKKTFHDKQSPIVNDALFLAIYTIDPTESKTTPVRTRDQFFVPLAKPPQRLVADHSELLATPARVN